MFTGLIADLGSVSTLEQNGAGATLGIQSTLAAELGEGDSVAVNGVCLTAAGVAGASFRAHVMRETLARSSLGLLVPGARVNLELPLRAADRMGGHFVQGHVDATGVVAAVRPDGFARIVELELGEGLERYLVEKGSVTIDGVSLTVSALRPGGFAVSLIPETLERTNLGSIGEGSVVNIEVDILAKHIERLLEVRP